MKKIAVIYWSGTGNTQKMAVALAEGAKADGSEVNVMEVSKASLGDLKNADAVALGCPSMGCEVLEEEEMEPFVDSISEEIIEGKPLALFGSFDWGDCQWMRDWEKRMLLKGAKIVTDGLTIQNTPDEEGLSRCRELGQKLVSFNP